MAAPARPGSGCRGLRQMYFPIKPNSKEHDVDAGTLKKIVLSDGAVVTVKGARALSLRLPLELPIPLNQTTYKDMEIPWNK